MANLKVSEMTEATSFDNGDYTMIVQANQNKKIMKENIFSNLENEISTNASDISTINTNIGNLSNLATEDKTSIVNSINELKNAEIYSTEEVKTNKIWIDGKPIYRKVCQMSNVAASGTGTFDLSSLNIETVWIDFSNSFYKSGVISLPLNRTHTGAITSQSEIRVTPSAISLICGSGIDATTPIITINYTKTTD